MGDGRGTLEKQSGWGSPGCSPVAPRLQCSGRVQCIAYPACPCACAVQSVPAPRRQRVQRHHQWAGRQGGVQRAAHQHPQSLGTLAPGSRARLLAQPRRAVPAASGSLGLPVTGNVPPLVMCLRGCGGGHGSHLLTSCPSKYPPTSGTQGSRKARGVREVGHGLRTGGARHC